MEISGGITDRLATVLLSDGRRVPLEGGKKVLYYIGIRAVVGGSEVAQISHYHQA